MLAIQRLNVSKILLKRLHSMINFPLFVPRAFCFNALKHQLPSNPRLSTVEILSTFHWSQTYQAMHQKWAPRERNTSTFAFRCCQFLFFAFFLFLICVFLFLWFLLFISLEATSSVVPAAVVSALSGLPTASNAVQFNHALFTSAPAPADKELVSMLFPHVLYGPVYVCECAEGLVPLRAHAI